MIQAARTANGFALKKHTRRDTVRCVSSDKSPDQRERGPRRKVARAIHSSPKCSIFQAKLLSNLQSGKSTRLEKINSGDAVKVKKPLERLKGISRWLYEALVCIWFWILVLAWSDLDRGGNANAGKNGGGPNLIMHHPGSWDAKNARDSTNYSTWRFNFSKIPKASWRFWIIAMITIRISFILYSVYSDKLNLKFID